MTKPTIYAVFQEGVYRHNCVGIFSTIDGAVCEAKRAMAAEYDDYHNYDVVPFVFDSVGEGDVAATISRAGQEVEVKHYE